MFKDDRPEDEGESGGRRSLLGLDRAAFAPAAPAPPPSARPARPAPAVPLQSASSGSMLGLEPFADAVASETSADRLRRPRAPENGDRAGRSFLGLDPRDAPPMPSLSAPRRRGPGPAARTARPEDDQADERSLFGLADARRAAVRPAPAQTSETTPPVQPARPKDLVRRDPLSLLSLRDAASPVEVEPPQFEHDLEPPSAQPIPVERAILLSLVLHLLLFFSLRWVPYGGARPGEGFLASLAPPEKPEDKIPLVFRSAPGPARENPKRSDPSDLTRRAGGGDRSRPKAETPFIPERPGIEGLSPGAGKSAARAAGEKREAAPQPSEKTAATSPEERARSSPETFNVAPPGPSQAGGAAGTLPDLKKTIEDVARQGVGAGQGGAGIPNPDGGFVDSGPVSFDTSWYDWGAYADEMVRRIKLHWDIPELARLGWKGRLTVRFFIMADGRVVDARIVSKSGVPPFDFAAFQSILKSDPFRPLPKDLLAQVPGKDREGITVTFFYNIRPERGAK